MTTRRFDPNRRNRIIQSALDLIAEEGVAGVSHRKIASRADVPLGSMTYHFAGIDELLWEAFSLFATSVHARFEERLARAATVDAAVEAIMGFIRHDVFTANRDLVLTLELYALAARQPNYRRLTHEWMSRSRKVLERYFDHQTAQEIDAFIEGVTIHRALDTEPQSEQLAAEALGKIISAPTAKAGIRSGCEYQ